MSAIAVSSLLEPLSDSAPSGANLEYDPRFTELERIAQPTAEQQYGDTIIEGKEPEWTDVRSAALELLGETHDLRIALRLTISALHTAGLQGLRDGLAVTHGFVEKFWESVHPQLDPDDDNDPTMRVNTIAGLCDNLQMLIPLRKAPLVSSRTVGRFSRLDMAHASGETPFHGPDDEKPKMSLIDAAFQECPLEQLEADAKAAAEAVELTRGIEVSVTKQIGAGNMRSLDALVKELEGIRKILAERLARRAPSAAATAAIPVATREASPNGAATAAASNGAAASAGAAAWNGEITSRAEAIKAIEGVCRYFELYEPSSPLPLLLHRAMRLSTKSFLEIMRDISPDGLSQAESLGGMTSDEYARLTAMARLEKPAVAARPAATPTPATAQAAPPSDDY